MAKKKSAKKAAGKSKKPGKKAAAKKGTAKKRASKTISLGRPTVTAEEKLFMLFHEDYEARQVFEFLRAETVADLEKFSPQEIIHRLSRPIREMVDRIRTKLAERNRCLAGDEAFAAEWKGRK
jgi:hypothetical protein